MEDAVSVLSRAEGRNPIARFAASERANVAVIFALACIPVVAAMGVAVDYTRAAQASSAMQDAVDAASLALSRQHGSADPDRRSRSSSSARTTSTPISTTANCRT